MGTTEPSKRGLESCDVKAIELVNLIKYNSHYDILDKKYKELLGAKRPLYHNALFMDANTLIETIKIAENTDVDEKDMRFQIERINLATFAYNVLREEKEFDTCVNTYFRSILPYFDEFTGEEISLYLAMRLFRLRVQFNDVKAKADAERRQLTDTERLKLLDTERRQLINQCFPKLRKSYYFLGSKKGEDQIMNAVEAILRFFRSVSLKDLGSIRFGGRALVNTFLRSFIEYRMERIGSEYREGSEVYPTSIEELRELVGNLFKTSVATDAFHKEEELEEKRYNDEAIDDDEQSEENSDSEQPEENSDSEQSEENSDSDSEKPDEDSVEVYDNDEANAENSDNNGVIVYNNEKSNNAGSDDNDKSSDKESFHSAADEDIFNVDVQLNTDSEEDELANDKSDNETETIKSIQSVKTKAKRRIVDEQPNAHVLTAEEADFSDNELPKNKYLIVPGLEDDDEENQTPANEPQTLPQSSRSLSVSSTAHSNRRLPSSSSRNGNSNISNNQDENSSRSSTIKNRKRPASPSPGSEDNEEPIPDGYYHDQKTQKRRKIPKTREKALFWTPDEVQALEDGLKQFKKRWWVKILEDYKSRLGDHTQAQLKDKARNEIIRRKKANLPLGGFYYAENPIP